MPASAAADGPLPKRDSVQSLVSLVGCPPPAPPGPARPAVRAVDEDGHAHAAPLAPNTAAVNLSAKRLHSVSLGALAAAASASLRDISLAANSLPALDLAPLSWCPSLAVLTLNSNRLASIDLSPLAACPRLERLWLHDNALTGLDLAPLANCPLLRSLYLEDNSIHDASLDLAPLAAARALRSLRLGGNKLAGNLNLTPLLQCASLSVFNVDSTVALRADAHSSEARVSPALRRYVLDIKFNPPPAARPRRPKGVTTPPVSPPSRRPLLPPAPSKPVPSAPADAQETEPQAQSQSQPQLQTPPPPPPSQPQPVIKVLLVGFRRLARYAAEDSLARCTKVIIRASTHAVASTDPALLLDSHVILLYAPPEKTVRQVALVAGHIPIVVVATERYRAQADSRHQELLAKFSFFVDPIDNADAELLLHKANRFLSGEADTPIVRSASSDDNLASVRNGTAPPPSHGSSISYRKYGGSPSGGPLRKSRSDNTITHSLYSNSSSKTIPGSKGDHNTSANPVNIEFEDIDDEIKGDHLTSPSSNHTSRASFNSHSHFSINSNNSHSNSHHKDSNSLLSSKDSISSKSGAEEIRRRLSELRSRRFNGSYVRYEQSDQGRSKLQAERAAIEASFQELGGYATGDSCAGLARICGLAKCAAPLLFRAAYGSAFEVEATTPEAGVPSVPLARKKRISLEAFLAYWDSRLRSYDAEERLSNVLEDSHFTQVGSASGGNDVGYSEYGAAPSHSNGNLSLKSCGNTSPGCSTGSTGSNFASGESSGNLMRAELWCPCDAGVEELVRSFMQGRTSRFGAYALVKLPEAVAIGVALILYALRGCVRGRVGGQARPVTPREVRAGKLNACLVAAEVGIFEGVTAGLSMNQIRSVKGCFATEAADASLSWTLGADEVKHYCVSRKTLLPGAVDRVMATHCRTRGVMSLAEFAVLLCVLSDATTDGAIDYFFSVVDVDGNDRWSPADLRHFHMEKERLWFDDGVAVADLADFWVNLLDMVGRRRASSAGLARRELFRLGARDRKAVIQTLLYVDDDYSSVNIRRTMELSKSNSGRGTSSSAVPVM